MHKYINEKKTHKLISVGKRSHCIKSESIFKIVYVQFGEHGQEDRDGNTYNSTILTFLSIANIALKFEINSF